MERERRESGSMPAGVLAGPQIASHIVPTSVIVITRDRPEGLARLLESLARQTQAPGEVVVVLNACRVSYDAVRAAFDRRLAIRWIVEPTPGVASARNAGVAASRGEILLFIDDDCEADPAWVERLATPFAFNPHIGIVGGEILSAPSRGATLVEEFCNEETLMQVGRDAADLREPSRIDEHPALEPRA